MLQKLYIKNYAIIEHLEIEFPNGMIAVTGETGAGKSIIIGAIQLAIGGKADSKTFKNAAEKCILEICFSIDQTKQKKIKQLIELDDYSEIILRREISTAGKSRFFINDNLSTNTEIQELAKNLISIHQQFDHLDILESNYQLEVLDGYCNNQNLVDAFGIKYSDYKKKISNLKKLEESNAKLFQEKEYLEFQFNELDKANLKIGELTELENTLKIAQSAEEIKSKTQASMQILQGDQGIQDSLHAILQNLKNIRINKQIEELYERVDIIRTDLIDINSLLEQIHEDVEFDNKKIEALQSKIDIYNRLLKKHHLKEDSELISLKSNIEEKLLHIQNADGDTVNLQNEIKEIEIELEQKSLDIRKLRIKHIPQFKKQIESLLNSLGMPNAIFDINLNPIEQFRNNGKDEIQFLFTANKGSQAKPLQNHASGGELSRVNLAIKSLLAEKSNLPTLIFDEIDTGVSGHTALQMGNILKQCSKNQQLITITHSPQVASRADHHMFVYKKTEAKNTLTQVKFLDLEEKYMELAKMLSSDPPTHAALQNAKELLSLKIN